MGEIGGQPELEGVITSSREFTLTDIPSQETNHGKRLLTVTMPRFLHTKIRTNIPVS